ncbi:NAD(P)/FAD-dependent oxidoreductase [Caldinitratiruptor microaerophilus]|uniref:FAD-dependent oxidoreductase n=1 Tax=Caldinitratiruptor microaerophilus TaxID=671077 RepID=A0AA35CJK5_9FIRM|nr:FAD-dependent oxidoreductase [Caldinitratiruptor microaerophilus]BDG59543.1 FAD-dependent oxidoreductase [Caldinitratiruptor microaerophilus]
MKFDYDVVVVGGGIVGGSVAFHLAEAGRSILVVDRAFPASGTSGATQSWVWVHTKSPPFYGEFNHLSAMMYPDFEKRLGADIEYQRTGGISLLFTPGEVEKARELVERQRAVGIDVSLLTREEILSLEPAVSPDVLGATYSPADGNVNSLRLVFAVMRANQARGVTYWTYTAVTGMELTDGGVQVHTERGSVTARQVAICGGPWAPELGAMLGIRIPVRPVRGQVLVTEPLAPLIRHTMVGMRQAVNGEMLIGFSYEEVGYDKGNSLAPMLEGARLAQRMVPALAAAHVVRCFSGLRAMPQDGLPILGPVPGKPGVFVAALHSGFTLAPLVGTLMAEVMCGEEPSVPMEPYSITRFG